jgi:copper transport protein
MRVGAERIEIPEAGKVADDYGSPAPRPHQPAEAVASRCCSARCALAFPLLGCVAAGAHATLGRSDPADGAVLAHRARRLVLVFNEPVSPLVLRLVGSDGKSVPLTDVTAARRR